MKTDYKKYLKQKTLQAFFTLATGIFSNSSSKLFTEVLNLRLCYALRLLVSYIFSRKKRFFLQ